MHRQVFLDLSVDQFFEEFHGDSPAFSYVDVAHACGHKNPVLHPWKDGQRRADSVVPVEGVPFISETRCQRTFSLAKRDASSLILKQVIHSPDAPYCDCFVLQDVWIIHGSRSNRFQERCLMTQLVSVHMTKYSFFKRAILERARAGDEELLDMWWKEATARGHLAKKNAPPKRMRSSPVKVAKPKPARVEVAQPAPAVNIPPPQAQPIPTTSADHL